MAKNEDNDVGRITIRLEMANYDDMKFAKAGVLPADKIHRAVVDAVVDSGATRLVLPAAVVKQLALSETGQTRVRYADERTALRPMVSDVWLRLAGREGVFSAVVEPKRKVALIGAIVMEELDLLVDCATQSVHPRDPDRVISEVE